MKKKLIVFNWKSNPQSAAAAIKLARAVEKVVPAKNAPEVVVAPPFTFLEDVEKIVKKAKLGAQDLSWEEGGAFTGEVSARELKNLSVRYVIAGHSERRKYLGETDEMINKKVLAALKAGLKVILCVGEDLSIRRRGKKAVEKFIKTQLEKDLKNIKNLKFKIGNLLIAYEPIWAIGTGHSDTPKDAVEIIKFIKRFLSVKCLYGGSVSGKNIKNFVEYKEIDGFLVGHASLKSKEVEKIVKISSR
ncbi:MAG: triose-phosphate isomerase [Patescibacteria group bacterium]